MEKEPRCRVCHNKLIERSTKQTAAQRSKPYYYRAYYWCDHCHKLFHDDKFKVVNKPLLVAEKKVVAEKPQHTHAPSKNTSYDVEIWTDGACVRNGTPRAKAAWAFVSGETERAGLIEGKQTNNIAEGLAIYHGLLWAGKQGYKTIKLSTDSQISLYNMKKPVAKIVANREIFAQIFDIIEKYQLVVDFIKVLGHSGDPNNDRVDKLANGLASK